MDKKKLFELISQGDIEGVFNSLQEVDMLDIFSSEISQQKFRWSEILKRERLGTVSIEWVTIEKNKVVNDMFYIINNIYFQSSTYLSFEEINPLRKWLDKYFLIFHKLLIFLGLLKRASKSNYVLKDYLKEILSKENYSIYIANRATLLNEKNYFEHKIHKNRQLKFINDVKSSISTKSIQNKSIVSLKNRIIGISGIFSGGDFKNASITIASNEGKNIKVINDASKYLLFSQEPVVLLGDPGSGKTKTLKQIYINLLETESKKEYPAFIVFKKLGGLFKETHSEINEKDILNFVKEDIEEKFKRSFDSLIEQERLIILFDGMDEISRKGYSSYIKALSSFAKMYKGKIKTLFSCRINDFDLNFNHKVLALLPFTEEQISKYIKECFKNTFPITVNNRKYNSNELIKNLSDLPLPINNPYFLSLVCFYVKYEEKLPNDKSQVVRYYIEKTIEGDFKETIGLQSSYIKKIGENLPNSKDFIMSESVAFQVLNDISKVAFIITNLNRGTKIDEENLFSNFKEENLDKISWCIEVAIQRGLIVKQETTIHFEHHRLQEFLSAFYIVTKKEEIEWESYFDKYRWREIYYYVIEMENDNNSIKYLTDSIERYSLVYEKNNDYAIEENYSNRIELSCRVLRNCLSKTSDDYGQYLVSLSSKSLNKLAKLGNEITQVRMIESFINCPEYFEKYFLDDLRNHKINWVRNYSEKILTESNLIGNREIGIAIEEEMCFDFSRGTLLKNINKYKKILKKDTQSKNHTFFYLGIGFVTIQVILSFFIILCSVLIFSSLLCFKSINFYSIIKNINLDIRYLSFTLCLATFFSYYLFLLNKKSKIIYENITIDLIKSFWLSVSLCICISIFIYYSAHKGPIWELLLILLFLLGVCFAYSIIFGLVFGTIISAFVAIYVLILKQLSGSKKIKEVSYYYRVSMQSEAMSPLRFVHGIVINWYNRIRPESFGSLIGQAIGTVVLLAIVGGIMILASWIWAQIDDYIIPVLNYIWLYLKIIIKYLLFVFAAVALFAIIAELAKVIDQVKNKVRAIFYAAFFLTIIGVLYSYKSIISNNINSVTSKISGEIFQIIFAFIFSAALIITALSYLFMLIKYLYQYNVKLSFNYEKGKKVARKEIEMLESNGKVKATDWVKSIEKADTYTQVGLLLNLNKENFEFNDEKEYLSLIQSIDKLIVEEPARSLYLEKRYILEQSNRLQDEN